MSCLSTGRPLSISSMRSSLMDCSPLRRCILTPRPILHLPKLLQLQGLRPPGVRPLQCEHTVGSASSPLAPRRQKPNPRCLTLPSLHGNPPEAATCREGEGWGGRKTERRRQQLSLKWALERTAVRARKVLAQLPSLFCGTETAKQAILPAYLGRLLVPSFYLFIFSLSIFRLLPHFLSRMPRQ